MRHVVVVGGSLGGLRAAQTLRSEGFDAKLTIISEEKWPAYDRPPLSKQVLRGRWDQDRIVLSGADDDSLGINWRRGVRAQCLDAGERRLTLSDGSTMSYDGLIVASGARARRLAGTENLRGVHSLRTLDDAQALRGSLRERARLVVVGAGFIGAEVAASARSMGAEVALVEPLSAPLARVLGDEMGEIMAQLHRDNGVDLRLGVGVESMEGQDQLRGVVLSDGTMIPADVAVVGIGVIPNVEWLEGNGFDLSNGVLCDETTQVAPGIVACGDVARWPNPLFGETMRVEHWEHTIDMAGHAARRLLAGDGPAEPYAPVPYFWSDQYDRKIQLAGNVRGSDEVAVVAGSVDDRRFCALYGRAGQVVGALTMNMPAKVINYRRRVGEGLSWAEAMAEASQ